MPQLHDFLGRFRPAAASSATHAAVPADERRHRKDELRPGNQREPRPGRDAGPRLALSVLPRRELAMLPAAALDARYQGCEPAAGRRAVVTGPQLAVPPAQVTISYAATMGIRYPAATSCAVPPPAAMPRPALARAEAGPAASP